jgi:hypothetical protein
LLLLWRIRGLRRPSVGLSQAPGRLAGKSLMIEFFIVILYILVFITAFTILGFILLAIILLLSELYDHLNSFFWRWRYKKRK